MESLDTSIVVSVITEELSADSVDNGNPLLSTETDDLVESVVIVENLEVDSVDSVDCVVTVV